VAAAVAAALREDGEMASANRHWLSDDEEKQIQAAVAAAEQHTSGEIVCLVTPSSHPYPLAEVSGATAIALPLALAATRFFGGWFWLGRDNMWLFLGIFALLFIAVRFILQRVTWLKRWFISEKEMEEEVAEGAMTAFYRHGVSHTRDRTGVLLYISLLEHKVWILADYGIHGRVVPGHWDAVVSRLTEGLRRGQAAAAICQAVGAIGAELRRHFPIQPADTNELRNIIIADE
jgi:putative membrane protein